jgi:hypothetical protein
MNPLPTPIIPGATEAERFNNALRKVFSVRKQAAAKLKDKPQPKPKKTR